MLMLKTKMTYKGYRYKNVRQQQKVQYGDQSLKNQLLVIFNGVEGISIEQSMEIST